MFVSQQTVKRSDETLDFCEYFGIPLIRGFTHSSCRPVMIYVLLVSCESVSYFLLICYTDTPSLGHVHYIRTIICFRTFSLSFACILANCLRRSSVHFGGFLAFPQKVAHFHERDRTSRFFIFAFMVLRVYSTLSMKVHTRETNLQLFC